jgi:uncharacterized membrane protein
MERNMRFLLINSNPAVSKLIDASLNRIGHEVTEISSYNSLSLDTYIAIIIDSDSYQTERTDDLLSLSLSPSLIYLKSQDKDVPENFQYVLRKPFLPTDFLAFIVSILTKTPELRRFVTEECKQFESIPLPEGAFVGGNADFKEEKQAVEAQEIRQDNLADYFANQNNFENKNPIFDIKESTDKTSDNIGGDIFSNLSDELGKLYDEGESASEVKADENSDVKENIPPHFEEQFFEQTVAAPQEPSVNDSNFALKDTNDASEEKPLAKQIDTPKDSVPLAEEAALEADKIDFNFDIFDKIEENTPAQNTDVASDKQDEAVLENKEDSEKEIKTDFGFEDLAKEFDDLIQGNSGENRADDNLPKRSDENELKTEHPKYEFEDLSEKDMKKALEESGMLPRSKDIEIAKAEIGQVVEQSVKGLLQSQILREVLKGLKMNITITFEDKE